MAAVMVEAVMVAVETAEVAMAEVRVEAATGVAVRGYSRGSACTH